MLYALCTQKKPSSVSFSHSQWIYGELVSQGRLLCECLSPPQAVFAVAAAADYLLLSQRTILRWWSKVRLLVVAPPPNNLDYSTARPLSNLTYLSLLLARPVVFSSSSSELLPDGGRWLVKSTTKHSSSGAYTFLRATSVPVVVVERLQEQEAGSQLSTLLAVTAAVALKPGWMIWWLASCLIILLYRPITRINIHVHIIVSHRTFTADITSNFTGYKR